jgi:hypothetical protein
MNRKQHKRQSKGKWMFKLTVLPQAEACGSVCFPWHPLEAVFSIPMFLVKR